MMLYVIWLLPLFGALALWAFGPLLRDRGGILACLMVGVSFGLTAASFQGATAAAGGLHAPLLSWIPGFTFGLWLDPLSLLWTLVITGIGFLIHVYSVGYMEGDTAVARFFAYMNFFVFAMLTLVLSDNFLGLLVGWGLVGLASYFLIGFWFERRSAVAAARKAFIVNVVGDMGLLFAILVMYAVTSSVTYADVFAQAGQFTPGLLLLVCIALFIGCAAKSAQVPLHTWLPDAMEGPTPVSALIHAATMVTAGVYLIARCAPLWDHSMRARELVGVLGAITAISGAILGIGQWDIKRILAYSTMSQIGYMILGVGVGAYEAGVSHFFTHAFFKAQLFLGSGLIIHALDNEQDVRRMGGLARRMPFAFAAMLLGTIAITGVLPIGGFFSKDAVIYGTLERGHPYLYAVAVLTAGITAYYMFRMIFLVFFGPDRTENAHMGHHGHLPAWIMQLPVAVLMVGTVFTGYFLIGGARSPWALFFAPLFPDVQTGESPPFLGEGVSSILVLGVVAIGMFFAYLRYGTIAARRESVERVRLEAERMPVMLTHAFYVDDLIAVLFVKPAVFFGRLCGRCLDPIVLDGIVRDVAIVVTWLGEEVRVLQNGLVRSYAFVVVAGAVLCIAYFAFLGVR
jgi:NADH-quinone oxidoreductase subunit L